MPTGVGTYRFWGNGMKQRTLFCWVCWITGLLALAAILAPASNAVASEPERDEIGPEDLATTMYHQLGITADKELMAPGGRPIEIVDGGKVVKSLLA